MACCFNLFVTASVEENVHSSFYTSSFRQTTTLIRLFTCEQFLCKWPLLCAHIYCMSNLLSELLSSHSHQNSPTYAVNIGYLSQWHHTVPFGYAVPACTQISAAAPYPFIRFHLPDMSGSLPSYLQSTSACLQAESYNMFTPCSDTLTPWGILSHLALVFGSDDE